MTTPHPLLINLKCDKSNANLPKWLEMVVDAGVVRIDLVSGNFVIDNKMHHE